MSIKLSVIVPCYNEEHRFEEGFNHYYSYLSKQKYPWELIFVDDGSKDQTLALMKSKSKDLKNIKIISYTKNRGKGYAIVQGVKNAKGKYVLFCDLDHSVPVQTIDSFFQFFKKDHPVVIGSRRVKRSKLIVRQHPLREFLGRGFTLLVNILICRGVKDATCGFKAFENSAARKIFNKITIYGWAFDAEILYICKKLDIKFAQAPVNWTDIKGSKVSLKKDIIQSLFGLVKIRINNFRGIYK